MSSTAADAFQQAFELHQRGDLDLARTLYDRVLAADPRHFAALQLLGILAAQTKQYERALDLLNRALEVDPDSAAAHCNRASALTELGRYDAAVAGYDRALALNANYTEAHAKRGVALAALKQFSAAIESYERAITLKPRYVEAHYNRGNALCAVKRFADAVAAYDRVLVMNPDHAAAHYNRGNAQRELGQTEAALRSYERAIALRPNYAAAHSNRGVVLNHLRAYDAAIASYDRAIALDPGHAEAHANRAKTLFELNRFEESLASCERAIALRPDDAFAFSHRGAVLKELGAWDDARASFDRAVEIDPANSEAHCNRGVLAFEEGRLSAAIASYDRAVELCPDFVLARINRAIALLLAGDYARGWMDYEARRHAYRAPDVRTVSGAEARSWVGQCSLAGKTILLHAEQGLGDTIQFCRYVPLVAAAGASVVLQVPEALKSALVGLAGVSQLLGQSELPPACDYYCPLMSLPLAFGTTLATIPAHVPYLAVDGDRGRLWAERLGRKTRPRVGLVWSGGFRPDRPDLWSVNRRRNIPLQQLAPLAGREIEFFSLQKGELAEQELAELKARGWNGPEVIDWTADLQDFADTAALIAQLDLVISVDTSTAHLAAALGKPVWLLNRFDTCWRWLLQRSDSPWYPTLTQYRQEQPGDWAPVVAKVQADLAQFRI
jgi:tetratricopeptide (TPR) repeat protein